MTPTPAPTIIVQTGAANVPWWAVPLLAGLFALIGVGIAQAVSLRLDRRRRAREDQRRLDAPLREAALKYLNALQDYATFVTSLTVGRLLITGEPSIVGEVDEFDRWSQHQHEIDDAMALLSLAAPEQLLLLAGSVGEPSMRFNLMAQEERISERMKYKHADEVYNLIGPFRNAVREYLGLERLEIHRADLASRARN